jgi:hypothetical protein
MDARGINEIGRELCQLLTQQMNALSERGSLDSLNADEMRAYKERRDRIAALRSELAKFAGTS